MSPLQALNTRSMVQLHYFDLMNFSHLRTCHFMHLLQACFHLQCTHMLLSSMPFTLLGILYMHHAVDTEVLPLVTCLILVTTIQMFSGVS